MRHLRLAAFGITILAMTYVVLIWADAYNSVLGPDVGGAAIRGYAAENYHHIWLRCCLPEGCCLVGELGSPSVSIAG